MKLGIVIPLKSKRVARDWDAVCNCLEETLRSLHNQSSEDWVAVVVGHERPAIRWQSFSDQISWVVSPHALPPITGGGSFSKYVDFDRILDKHRKMGIGMRHLQGQGVTDWYVLDADDLVHRDFVRTLNSLPHQAGWLCRTGYLWYKDLQRWMPCDKMLNLCGSTAVISAALFSVPSTDRDDGLVQIPWCRMSHSNIEAFLTPHLAGADPTFPFPAIAYTLSHGDNCSDEFRATFYARLKVWIKKKFFTRSLEAYFAHAFGINFSEPQ
jgi:hypothetical protein